MAVCRRAQVACAGLVAQGLRAGQGCAMGWDKHVSTCSHEIELREAGLREAGPREVEPREAEALGLAAQEEAWAGCGGLGWLQA